MSEKERKKNSRVSHPAVLLAKALADQAMPDSELARLLDGEALLVLREPLLAFVVRHLVEQHARALELDALHVVQRPHLRLVELDVRLRDEGVAVVADVAEVLEDVLKVPTVVQGLPLALAGEPAHGGRRPTVVLLAEGYLVRPVASIRAVGFPLAVDVVEDRVLADQARHHAGPAAVRVHVAGVLERYRLVAVRLGEVPGVLPPPAAPVAPAGVLVLEPLEVFLGHRVDAPVVGEPAGGEEAS